MLSKRVRFDAAAPYVQARSTETPVCQRRTSGVLETRDELQSILEALMLVCFGVACPPANLRMLRSCNAEGMGAAFTAIILCGYVAGALAKWMAAADGAGLAPVFWLYLINTSSVAVNLALQWHFYRRAAAPPRCEAPPPKLAPIAL